MCSIAVYFTSCAVGRVKIQTASRNIKRYCSPKHLKGFIIQANPLLVKEGRVAEFILETNYPSGRITSQTDSSSMYKSEDDFFLHKSRLAS